MLQARPILDPMGNIHINSNLDLSMHEHFSTLPANLSISGHLALNDCFNLTNLPNNIRVETDLYLSNCLALRSLPSHLEIGGDLNISSCTNLGTLPTHLSIGGNLVATGCSMLTTIGAHLSLGKDLYLDYCTSLTTLPPWILQLGPTAEGENRLINLSASGFSPEAITELMASDHPGISIIINDEINPDDIANILDQAFDDASETHQAHVSLAFAAADWLAPSEARHITLDDWGLTEEQNLALIDFLTRLQFTADANNDTANNNLRRRVAAFLQQMQHNQNDFRAIANECIDQLSTTCEDGIITIFSNIEQLMRVQNALSSTEPAERLRQLGKSFFALEIVHQHAKQKCTSMQFGDQIEVYLAFELNLKSDLDLPINTEKMFYEQLAQITLDDIDYARTQALTALADPVQVSNFLSRWAPWQTFERRQLAQQFDWNSLSATQQPFNQDDCCIISAKTLDSMIKPVCIGNALYELDELLRYWIEKGMDPSSKKALDLAQLQRVLISRVQYDQ